MPLIDSSTVCAAGSAGAFGASSIGPPRSGHRSSSRRSAPTLNLPGLTRRNRRTIFAGHVAMKSAPADYQRLYHTWHN
jgi:hypothetical protein